MLNDVKLLTENERFQILDLSDKIMIGLNEIPRESITLPVFNYWYNFLVFERCFPNMIIGDNSSKKFIDVMKSVAVKVYIFFFRSLIYFEKMNIQVVDANINAQKSESYVEIKFLMLVIERIKNCETIQDLIDGSPTAECPVCMDVTFTESTHFIFRVGCNHLVCLGCTQLAVKSKSKKRLAKKYIYFFFDSLAICVKDIL